MIKAFIKKLPLINSLARFIYHKWIKPPEPFTTSEEYWVTRYASGGNSGPGSYNQLSEFKAEILNDFVEQNRIHTIIEYGCGDGNQLKLAQYPHYTGFDVSPRALSLCSEAFANDGTKSFKLMKDYQGERAELNLSLDVLFHLVEDDVYEPYMHRLFDSAEHYVIIYSTDSEAKEKDQAPHVRHRNFTGWVKRNKPEWKLLRHIPNRYPLQDNYATGSSADFYIYTKS